MPLTISCVALFSIVLSITHISSGDTNKQTNLYTHEQNQPRLLPQKSSHPSVHPIPTIDPHHPSSRAHDHDAYTRPHVNHFNFLARHWGAWLYPSPPQSRNSPERPQGTHLEPTDMKRRPDGLVVGFSLRVHSKISRIPQRIRNWERSPVQIRVRAHLFLHFFLS